MLLDTVHLICSQMEFNKYIKPLYLPHEYMSIGIDATQKKEYRIPCIVALKVNMYYIYSFVWFGCLFDVRESIHHFFFLIFAFSFRFTFIAYSCLITKIFFVLFASVRSVMRFLLYLLYTFLCQAECNNFDFSFMYVNYSVDVMCVI